ncbi:YceI family protein [Oceanobacter antarcticus]|uniref:YceI family protein n=1 Tax=Oceanobacter antarcticus TaxID=3133425 RepID=A0ABW8NP65_9GAMM
MLRSTISSGWRSALQKLSFVLIGFFGFSTHLFASDYIIDPTHSFVEFRVQHLGYSWLYGRFNTLQGSFSYDSNKLEQSYIKVEIAADSIDTNHAERDKHLRSDDFLDVARFPKAVFTAASYEGDASEGTIMGNLTLHGVTRQVVIEVSKVGEGKDPWGGYRAGFWGRLILTPGEFGIDYDLGSASASLEMELSIEGTKN